MQGFETYKLFAVTALVGFLVGIITFKGTVDIAMHDNFFIIEERDIVIVLSLAFILCSIIYYLLLKFRKPVNEKLGRLHFILTVLSLIAAVATHLFIQNEQLNRNYTDTVNALNLYEESLWFDWESFIIVFNVFFIAQIIFLVNILTALTKKNAVPRSNNR